MMMLRLVLLTLTLGVAACNTCDQTATTCKECGPAGGCLDGETVEICVSDTCETADDCDEGALCSNGTCAPMLCL